MSDSPVINNAEVAVTDLEWSGALNRSLNQGKKFALLLSMLEEDVSQRPHLRAEPMEQSASTQFENYYRRAPLATSPADWQAATHCSGLINRSAIDGLLWCAMHPQPLSIYNDNSRIDDEVLANCSHHLQARMRGEEPAREITTDATQLYDILQAMN